MLIRRMFDGIPLDAEASARRFLARCLLLTLAFVAGCAFADAIDAVGRMHW